MCSNNSNAVMTVTAADCKPLLCYSKLPLGTRKNFFDIYKQLGHAPSQMFASPALASSLSFCTPYYTTPPPPQTVTWWCPWTGSDATDRRPQWAVLTDYHYGDHGDNKSACRVWARKPLGRARSRWGGTITKKPGMVKGRTVVSTVMNPQVA